MEEYVLYAAKNILQIKKSQQNTKLDRDVQNAIKNHIIEIEIFDSNNTNANNLEEDNGEGDEENIDLPIIDLYSYVIVMTHIH